MGYFTDLSELLVFMSCGLMLYLTDRGSRIRQHFARTTCVSLEDGDLSHLCTCGSHTEWFVLRVTCILQVYPCPPLKWLGQCGWEEKMVVS